MKKAIWVLVLAIGMSACDESEPNGSTEAEAASVGESEPESAGAKTESKEGTFSFTVDGEEKSFGYLPAEKNLAIPTSTLLVGRPSADASEELNITAMNFNVKEADLPATLKLEMKEAMKEGDAMKFAKSPKPLVQYTTTDGVKYRSYAEITFESFENGVVKGSVGDMEMQAVKAKDEPAIKIAGMTFSVAL